MEFKERNAASPQKKWRGTHQFALVGFAAFTAFASSGAVLAAENYTVIFNGAPKGLKPKLSLISSLALEARPYPTMAAVRRAGISDIPALNNALRAAGYYRGVSKFELDRDDDGKIRAIYIFDPGERFEITDHKIEYRDEISPDERWREPDAAGLSFGENADGAALQANQQEILSKLRDAGYPIAQSVARRATPTPNGEATATATYVFETGPRAQFGPLQISGLRRTKTTFLEKLKAWEEGELFERSKLIEFQDGLGATGLFNTIDVAPGPLDSDGASPVVVTVEERKTRTIGVGGSFSTTEGPGGRLFFEYRNLFGAGEKLRAEIEASEVQQSFSSSLEKPFPKLPGVAVADFAFLNETTDAFDAQTVTIAAALSKKWLENRLETRAGATVETSRITQDGIEERNFFAAFPLTAVWNTETDPLALDQGSRAALIVTPYAGSELFTQVELTGRSRTTFGEDGRYTLAGRFRFGATVGAENDLPLNKRFYAGGGSSVRGFDFQAVGPLEDDGDPIGGRSVVEAAIEARAKVFGPVQLAAFVDTGSVSESNLPNFGERFFTGVGGGARYLSPIGPLRVDFALPLDRRTSDRAWQLYISLGQPF